MKKTRSPTPPNSSRVFIRTCLLAASALLVAPTVLAQGDELLEAEKNQREAEAPGLALLEAQKKHDIKQREAAKYFSVVAHGVVKDSRTGLEWMRCSLGQDWDEEAKTCKGSVRKYTWQGAQDFADELNKLNARKTNWRVPTVRELQSLRYCSNGFLYLHVGTDIRALMDLKDGKEEVPSECAAKTERYRFAETTIAETIFPAMDWYNNNLTYWSASRHAVDDSRAWCVSFLNGHVQSFCGRNNGVSLAVRLVR